MRPRSAPVSTTAGAPGRPTGPAPSAQFAHRHASRLHQGRFPSSRQNRACTLESAWNYSGRSVGDRRRAGIAPSCHQWVGPWPQAEALELFQEEPFIMV